VLWVGEISKLLTAAIAKKSRKEEPQRKIAASIKLDRLINST